MGILNKLRGYIKAPKQPIDNQNIEPVIREINKKLDKLDKNLEGIENYLSKKFKTFEKKA